MAEEIINRVANSVLKTIDLEDFYPEGQRLVFDISPWLYEGLLLRENDFRDQVKMHDWSQYSGTYVAISCKTDAIIPSWAYLLLATKLQPVAAKVVVGDLELLETLIFNDVLGEFDCTPYQNMPVIIKGCANRPIPQTGYLILINKLLPVVRSLMYGEACSTVPLFKK